MEGKYEISPKLTELLATQKKIEDMLRTMAREYDVIKDKETNSPGLGMSLLNMLKGAFSVSNIDAPTKEGIDLTHQKLKLGYEMGKAFKEYESISDQVITELKKANDSLESKATVKSAYSYQNIWSDKRDNSSLINEMKGFRQSTPPDRKTLTQDAWANAVVVPMMSSTIGLGGVPLNMKDLAISLAGTLTGFANDMLQDDKNKMSGKLNKMLFENRSFQADYVSALVSAMTEPENKVEAKDEKSNIKGPDYR